MHNEITFEKFSVSYLEVWESWLIVNNYIGLRVIVNNCKKWSVCSAVLRCQLKYPITVFHVYTTIHYLVGAVFHSYIHYNSLSCRCLLASIIQVKMKYMI